MFELNDDKTEKLEELSRQRRRCSEVYSCTEDFSYFLTLTLPFVN